jgi:hypothetical protein
LIYKYKHLLLIFAITLSLACQDQSDETADSSDDTAEVHKHPNAPDTSEYDDEPVQDTINEYSGERFRNVRVEQIGDSTFEVTGQAQVFEAAFSWVINDGQQEIQQGHATTDAGAPAWGNFKFNINAAKPASNTILQLILFEASPKDGSRQHELPIVLYR